MGNGQVRNWGRWAVLGVISWHNSITQLRRRKVVNARLFLHAPNEERHIAKPGKQSLGQHLCVLVATNYAAAIYCNKLTTIPPKQLRSVALKGSFFASEPVIR